MIKPNKNKKPKLIQYHVEVGADGETTMFVDFDLNNRSVDELIALSKDVADGLHLRRQEINRLKQEQP